MLEIKGREYDPAFVVSLFQTYILRAYWPWGRILLQRKGMPNVPRSVWGEFLAAIIKNKQPNT